MDDGSPPSTAVLGAHPKPTSVARVAGRKSDTRVAFAGFISGLIEEHDFVIYSTTAALVFQNVFFPALGSVQGISASLATLGIAFSANLFGSVIFGHFGMQDVPNSTIKYTMAGSTTQAALIAAYFARAGHTGDRRILDDADFGYRKFICSDPWEPETRTGDLGQSWRFPAEHSYKPDPHCRVTHPPRRPDVLDGRARHRRRGHRRHPLLGRGMGGTAGAAAKRRGSSTRAQFSIAHGLAVVARRLPPGPAWQSPEALRSKAVLDLMAKVTFAPHPGYAANLTRDPAIRPTRVEIDSRGETFAAERHIPESSSKVDPSTHMTTDELVTKFRSIAVHVRVDAQIDELVDCPFVPGEDRRRPAAAACHGGRPW